MPKPAGLLVRMEQYFKPRRVFSRKDFSRVKKEKSKGNNEVPEEADIEDPEEDQSEPQGVDKIGDVEVDLPTEKKKGEGTKEKEKIYVSVEKEPSFPGGKEAMFEYVDKALNYPDSAKEAGIEGTVFINFVINKDGSITNVKVRKGVNEALNEEAIRVVKNMPDWNPGKIRYKPVRVQYRVPVRFSLD